MRNRSTAGTTAVRIGSTFAAALVAGAPAVGAERAAGLDQPEVVERQGPVESIGQGRVHAGGAESRVRSRR